MLNIVSILLHSDGVYEFVKVINEIISSWYIYIARMWSKRKSSTCKNNVTIDIDVFFFYKMATEYIKATHVSYEPRNGLVLYSLHRTKVSEAEIIIDYWPLGYIVYGYNHGSWFWVWFIKLPQKTNKNENIEVIIIYTPQRDLRYTNMFRQFNKLQMTIYTSSTLIMARIISFPLCHAICIIIHLKYKLKSMIYFG